MYKYCIVTFIMIKTAQVFLSYSPIVDVYGNSFYIIL